MEVLDAIQTPAEYWTFSDDDTGKSRDGLYEPVLAESEREAVADLLQYLENVCILLYNSEFH